MIPLGPFHLHSPIARGGMGAVWLATHHAEGLPVAVKVLEGPRASSPQVRAALRFEIRALAGLMHPNVVTLLDQRPVDEAAAQASDGRLELGSPTYTMELAEGTLQHHMERGMDWGQIRPALVQILAGLAHAHAAGIVHRDIKPQNVLRVGSLWKLADFGIAHRIEEASQTGLAAGTPGYTAPEQVLRQASDQGPWTDLYALGCLAWKMTTGTPVFFGTSGQVLHAQIHAMPLAYLPRTRVPEGLEEWLRALMHKDPRARFARAADAATALAILPEPSADTPVRARRAAEPTQDYPTGALPTPTPAPRRSNPAHPPGPAASRTAPLPAEPPLEPAPPTRMRSAGMSLYGLRRMRMVDRTQERAELWQALADVHTHRSPHVVVLRGAAGTGKSALARWLCEASHSAGAAEVMKATHHDPPGPRDGLAAMAERWLRVVGLARPDIVAHVSRWLNPDPGQLAAFVELVRPRAVQDALGGLRWADLASPEKRRTTLVKLVAQASRQRPALVWLDDAQWSPEVIRFARQLQQSDLPVLVVLTVHAAVSGTAHGLLEGLQAQTIEVLPLHGADRSELVQGLLGLSGQLAERVQERSQGNPLFAVQLVGDWVSRGLLEAGADGYRLRPGAVADVPDRVHQLWLNRVARLLQGRPTDDLAALEVAAALGQQVDQDEWSEATTLAGCMPSQGLAEQLCNLGLATATDSGFALVHGMLAESLRRQAREAGRWTVAAHAAGSALVKRAQRLTTRGRPREAERLFDRAARVVGGGQLEPLWAQAHVGRGLALLDLGRPREAERCLLGTLERADDPSVRADATHGLGMVYRSQGRMDEAKTHLDEALQLHREQGNQVAVARTLGSLGLVHSEQARNVECEGTLRRALEVLDKADAPRVRVTVLTYLGNCMRRMHRVEECEAAFREALALCATHGLERKRAIALGDLAILSEIGGNVPQAVALLNEARELHRKTGSRRFEGITSANLAYYTVDGLDPEGSKRRFEDAIVILEEVGERRFLGIALTNLGNLLRSIGDLDGGERALRQGLALLEETRNRRHAARATALLALLADQRGDSEGARAGLRQAMIKHDAAHDMWGTAFSLIHTVDLHYPDELGVAQAAATQGLELLPVLADARIGNEMRSVHALAFGDLAAARAAHASAQTMPDSFACPAAGRLAMVAAAAGEPGEARAALEEAQRRSTTLRLEPEVLRLVARAAGIVAAAG
jgi:eukaryotic-like serine/threonine-protein kinase